MVEWIEILHVNPSIVIHIHIRFPIFFLQCLYQIFCFGGVHALYCSSSFLYNMWAPAFFLRLIYVLSIYILHFVSPFMY